MPKRDRMTEDKIAEMRRMRAGGMRAKDIAEAIGCSTTCVSNYTSDVIVKMPEDWTGANSCRRGEMRDFNRLRKTLWENMGQERAKNPCTYCRWRRDGAQDIVCMCYRERWGSTEKGAPRFGKIETEQAAKRLGTTPEEAARILSLWDRGRGSVDDVVDEYKDAMGWR